MKNKNENKRISELETALREALSGIDEFMTRTIYRVHGEDIERWRKALEGANDEANLRHRLKVAEEAATQPVTNCNHLGDEAKMREALVKSDAAFRRISQSAWFIDANFSDTKEVMDAGNAVASALSAHPRNCDRFSNANEALEAFEKETGETMIEFIRWLFAEARGGAK